MIEIIIFHFQDTNVQSETFSKELLHDISHATQLSILHVSKVTKFSPECVAHEILIGSFSIDDGKSSENVHRVAELHLFTFTVIYCITILPFLNLMSISIVFSHLVWGKKTFLSCRNHLDKPSGEMFNLKTSRASIRALTIS